MTQIKDWRPTCAPPTYCTVPMTVGEFMEHFDLVVEGRKFDAARLYLCTELIDVTMLKALEAMCSEALVVHLSPRIRGGRYKTAIDLTFIRYHEGVFAK